MEKPRATSSREENPLEKPRPRQTPRASMSWPAAALRLWKPVLLPALSRLFHLPQGPRGRVVGAGGRADTQESHQEALEPGLQAGGTAGTQERRSELGNPLGRQSGPAMSQDDGSERYSVTILSHVVPQRVILTKI